LLVKKLTEVMKEVKYIQKRGYNKFHKYNYATEADVNEKVREELSKVNVIMIPNMVNHETREHTNRNGNTEYIVTVDMEFRFIDGESGEEITFKMSGSGQDAGDKGIFKAIAGAQKYALMKAFMIPTGDDPEADTGTDERNHDNKQPQQNGGGKQASEKQLNLVNSLLKKKISDKWPYDTLYANLKQKIGTTKEIENWSVGEASKAIEVLQSKGA
jgi:hypothetical protein